MPLVSEIPEPIQHLDTLSKLYASKMQEQIQSIGQTRNLQAQTELYSTCQQKFVYILKGDFKLIQNKKIIRLFSQNDIYFFSDNLQKKQLQFFCEYASQIIIFDYELLTPLMQEEYQFANVWNQWQRTQIDLNTLIQAHYISVGIKPDLEMKSFERGEAIIQENDDSDEIYEMMDGRASVITNGVKVGNIEEGDIFGELSFLIQSKRTANVIAEKACTVNIIKREDFMELIKHRPQLIYNIARNLAKRILYLNQKHSE